MCRQYLTFGPGSNPPGSSPVSISRRMSPARRGLRKTWRWPTRRLLGQQARGEQRLADLGGELAVVAGEAAREVGEVGVVAAPLPHAVEALEDPARDAAGGIGVVVGARRAPRARRATASTASSCSSTDAGSAGRPPSRATASATRSGWWEPIGSRRRRRRRARRRGRRARRARRRSMPLGLVVERERAELLERRRARARRRGSRAARGRGALPDADRERPRAWRARGGSVRSTSAPTTAATSSQRAVGERARASACRAALTGTAASSRSPSAASATVTGSSRVPERFWPSSARAVAQRVGEQVAQPRGGLRRRLRRRRRRRARRRGSRREGGVERRPGGLAVDGEDDALEPRAPVEVAAHLLDLDARGVLEREAADAGAERDEREAPGARARRPSRRVEAVARRMMSSDGRAAEVASWRRG